ncbi:MAG: molecular chaperone TorD family protein [Sulfuritalea sp.]|nr:molecular chaperone TorD family protein [Sulfuritalea sp.]
MSDSQMPTLLHEKADFYLMLARAFLAPMEPAHYQAMTDMLAEDLADLDASLGYGIAPQLEGLRAAMSKLSSHEELLVEYSQMFLQPPREAALNVCFPLDGAMMGGTVTEIEDFYRHYGVERGDHFKDLPDHASVQLEFISYLYGRAAEGIGSGEPDTEAEKAAGHFLHQFVSRWLPHLELGIEKAGKKLELKANPWLPLVRILAIATGRDAEANPDWVKPQKRVDVAIEKARRDYAAKGITPEAMADIERKLREKGLSTDHLQVDLDQRNAALGLSAKQPPDPRRK